MSVARQGLLANPGDRLRGQAHVQPSVARPPLLVREANPPTRTTTHSLADCHGVAASLMNPVAQKSAGRYACRLYRHGLTAAHVWSSLREALRDSYQDFTTGSLNRAIFLLDVGHPAVCHCRLHDRDSHSDLRPSAIVGIKQCCGHTGRPEFGRQTTRTPSGELESTTCCFSERLRAIRVFRRSSSTRIHIRSRGRAESCISSGSGCWKSLWLTG